MMSEKSEVIANGRPFPIDEGLSLDAFLQKLGFVPGQVVVEHNGQAVTPSESKSLSLNPGDRLEIVQIVAGG